MEGLRWVGGGGGGDRGGDEGEGEGEDGRGKESENEGGGESEGGGIVFVLGCGGVAEWAFVEGCFAGEEGEGKVQAEVQAPWVERREVLEGMGYLGRGRRVRKFMV